MTNRISSSPAAIADRPLHLIDVDNITGDPSLTDTTLIGQWLNLYRTCTGYRPGDHVIVGTGCNGEHVYAVQSCWPTVHFVRRCGPDGADTVLIEEALIAAQRGRYTRFILGSGDHIFLQTFDALANAGYRVTVACRPKALSNILRQRAGNDVIYLPDLMPI